MKKTIQIEGMSCMHCVHHVKMALSSVAGVTNVEVSLKDNKATIDAAVSVTDNAIKQAVDEAGYTATHIE